MIHILKYRQEPEKKHTDYLPGSKCSVKIYLLTTGLEALSP